MDLRKYLCVDSENIILIDYIFMDHDLDSLEYSYPKSRIIPIGGDNSEKIFDKNGVPKEYQKMFMTCNSISMLIHEIKDSSRNVNLSINRFKRFKAKEYLTEIPIYLSLNDNNVIFGQMGGEKPTFNINNCYVCEKEDIIQFFISLKKQNYLDNYLRSLEEIMHFNIIFSFDYNRDNSFKYSKKNR